MDSDFPYMGVKDASRRRKPGGRRDGGLRLLLAPHLELRRHPVRRHSPGDMYVSWYMPDDDPALIVEALRGAGLTVSRPLDPNKRIRVTTGNPGRWSDLESQAIDAAVERLVDLLDDGASDPREAAIQAMQSLPDELLNHLDPARFIRVMVDEHEGKVDA